jgi:hypothetical protein
MHSHSPRVGIFYVIGMDLYIESTLMIEGEDWGDFKTYPNGHIEYWAVLTRQLKLLSCLSYDFYPRGRVSYAKAQDTYMLYLDRCLVKNRQTIRLIKRNCAYSSSGSSCRPMSTTSAASATLTMCLILSNDFIQS